ncbi:MAG: hypothetical protein KAJ86_07460, partial [Alphaproteobacteria bacterium]|nr:hypothetical protein [Alphaproteobacteria bacterium]
ISRMAGVETLAYEDEHKNAQACHAKRQAVQAFLSGDDPLSVGLNYAHHNLKTEIPDKQQRLLCTPDEVLNAGEDKQYIFADNLSGVLYADRKPYYKQKFMVGRYHPNPFYPPLDKVRVKTRFGCVWRQIVTKAVSPEFAHYPQYSDGSYSCVE